MEKVKTEKEELQERVDLALQMHAREYDVLVNIGQRVDKLIQCSKQDAKRFDALEIAVVEIRETAKHGYERLASLEALLRLKAIA